jgi:hypothetical protein
VLKMPPKVEEPILVKFIIWTLKTLLFRILQSPKLVTLLLEVEMRPFHIRIGRKTRQFHIRIAPSISLGIHVEEERS